jgi:hypothetical protein
MLTCVRLWQGSFVCMLAAGMLACLCVCGSWIFIVCMQQVQIVCMLAAVMLAC